MALANQKPDREKGEIKCYSCAIFFAVAPDILAAWMRSGQTFYCPNGHGQCFGGGEVEQLKKQLETANATAAAHRGRWQQAETRANVAEARASNAELERAELLERTCAGQCPFCSREFQNLQKHVAAKHPTREPEQDKPAKRRAPRRKAAGDAPEGERAAEG